MSAQNWYLVGYEQMLKHVGTHFKPKEYVACLLQGSWEDVVRYSAFAVIHKH
jgi:hypothetical protein